MAYLVHQFVKECAQRTPEAQALLLKASSLDYAALDEAIARCASGLTALGLGRDERVAIYLPKRFETVVAMLGTLAAGGVMVPINPSLKPAQVGHILSDSAAALLVTSQQRIAGLDGLLGRDSPLRGLIVVDGPDDKTTVEPIAGSVPSHTWSSLTSEGGSPGWRRIDRDLAAILYTSGSTGRPKGVVLSHRNLVAGAQSVATYLANTASDRLLAVLPFSFDYGLSQLTTAFSVGASVVLMDYLLPRDVIAAVARYGVTGLAAVPPLWNQLAALDWPEETVRNLRYLTSSGGKVPRETTRRLREKLPQSELFLMYGLTEAFRSTFLAPDLTDARPDSIGRAIPNAEVMVVRPDGSECGIDEPGELVHRGALVACGYWNDPQETARRFRPAPGQPDGLPGPEIAVWSGDTVRKDEEGLLYFVGRNDEMIKTSGYRVSPTEIEEVAYALEGVEQAVALGVPHPVLGQAIVLVLQPLSGLLEEDRVLEHCRRALPAFMVPARIVIETALPRGSTGKIDRKALADRFGGAFSTGQPG